MCGVARLGYAMVLCLCWGCARPTDDVSVQLDAPLNFHAKDGAEVHAWCVSAEREQRTRVLLVHMLGRTHRDWDSFAAELAQHGYASWSIDLRGHGDSVAPEGPEVTYRQFTPEQWLAATKDVTAALEFMGDGPKVIIGASIGANLSLRAAAEQPDDIVGVAALSPGLDFRGVTTEGPLQELKPPLFLAACDGDSYSFESVGKLASLDPQATVYRGRGKFHGTEMLGVAEGLDTQLLEWLDGLVD